MAWLQQIATQIFNGVSLLQKVILGSGLDYNTTTKVLSVISDSNLQWSVIAIQNTPPVSSTTGDIYAVGNAGTGLWSGHNTEIATTPDNGASWTFQVPSIGDFLYNASDDIVYKLTSSGWIAWGKASIHQGGDSYGAQIRIGSIDNSPMAFRTHNVSRITISNAGVITLNSLTGATSQVVGISSAGVLSRVDVLSTALTNMHILVGNISDVATDVAMSGDATLANTGAVTLASVVSAATKGSASKSPTVQIDVKGRVVALSDQDIAIVAGQVALNNTNILVGNVSNVAAGVAMSGDAAITNTGVLSLSANLKISSIGAFATGNGTVIPTGSIGFITIPYTCTINNWYVAANLSGTIQFDIKRSGTSIIGGGNKPALSGALSANAAATSWTSVAVTAGDILEFVVDSSPAPATLTNCSVVLKVTKT